MMLFLVDLPKPVHGMSTINQAMLDRVSSSNNEIDCINTVPSWASKYFDSPLWTPLKIFHSALCIGKFLIYAILHPKAKVYRSVNGGTGQLFDIFYFSISRIFRLKLYIHHHSFSYLNRRSRLFAFLSLIAGPEAVHICLGPSMAARLRALYRINPTQTRVISNLAFFDGHETNGLDELSSNLVIGHLANLTFEKGLDTFLTICERLEDKAIPYSAYIAGPASTPAVEDAITQAIKRKQGRITYLGPVYGHDKKVFFERLDAFVFPSRYVNEAEPLVLYEAAMQGAFLAGTRRGCMGDIIEHFRGLTAGEDEDTADALCQGLISAQQNGTFQKAERQERRELFSTARQEALTHLDALISELS